MHKIQLRLFLVLIYSAVSFTGCGKKTVEHPSSGPPAPFKITVIESGGFTGGVEGYSISSDGKVEKFQQMPGQEKKVILTSMAKKSEIEDYRTWFENSGLMQKQLNEKGNMTTTVRFENADTTYVWSFPSGGVAGSPALKELDAWCAKFKNSVNIEK